MSAPRSLTANYGVQYQLTLATDPAAVGTSHIAGASTGDWFDSGSTVNLTADLNVAKDTGERYPLLGLVWCVDRDDGRYFGDDERAAFR